MKTICQAAALLVFTIAFAGAAPFTYQGRLIDQETSANGIYGFRLRLVESPFWGTVPGTRVVTNVVAVTNGLFTTEIDVGAFPHTFAAADLFLEIWVRRNSGTNPFTLLEPRQRLTSTPQAIFAQIASGITSTGDQPVTLIVNGEPSFQVLPTSHRGTVNVLGGSSGNFIASNAVGSVIAGGGTLDVTGGGAGASLTNQIRADYAFIGGGYDNTIEAHHSFIGGGSGNRIDHGSTYGSIPTGGGNHISNSSPWCVIAGGASSRIGIGSSGVTISGGLFHEVGDGAIESTVSGGHFNVIGTNASYSTIAGGMFNQAGGEFATVAGGRENSALGQFSFAAGLRAIATHPRSFVWSDGSTNFHSATNNTFNVLASGGTTIASASGVGVTLPPGSGSWVTLSDRTAKRDFATVKPALILEKLRALPISTWRYATEMKTVRHIGPTAQDFAASFGLGNSSNGISTVDADGVALAAIQALAERVEQQEDTLAQRDKFIRELEMRLQSLERRSQE